MGKQMGNVHEGEWVWREPRRGNFLRTCNYCGSINPDDLAPVEGWVPDWADWKYGWPHKAYINQLAIKLGMTEREAKLHYISDVIEREVKSSKELTMHEAKRCIDYLLKDVEQMELAEESKRDGD